jgi:hypothetical protein
MVYEFRKTNCTPTYGFLVCSAVKVNSFTI